MHRVIQSLRKAQIKQIVVGSRQLILKINTTQMLKCTVKNSHKKTHNPMQKRIN